MSSSRLFECGSCGAYGKITLKGEEYETSDIECCPICGSDISQVEEDYDEDES